MSAIIILSLIHVPPAVELDSIVVDPSQTVMLPVIAAGSALTVTVTVRTQPDDTT
jgi:hypothetical protein